MTETELESLREWEGAEERVAERAGLTPARALLATLDRDPCALGEGDELPPLYHWLYCVNLVRQGALGADGHVKRGGFLPPFPFPRRMFAGARIRFRGHLHVGERLERKSTVRSIQLKEGRRGQLLVLEVQHRVTGDDGGEVIEEQDLIYLPGSGEPTRLAPDPAAPMDGSWSRQLIPDSRLLFRFSALTFNAHRIHYDQDFACREEGYPGLVVHGPLTALLLADLIARHAPESRLGAFSFRAQRPMFADRAVTLEGRQVGSGFETRALDDTGTICMTAEGGA